MCSANAHAQAVYVIMVLAALTYSISSSYILFDHLLATDPCEHYDAGDCFEFACQEYTSDCPCEIIHDSCVFKDEAVYPIIPKACKHLQDVSMIESKEIYQHSVYFAGQILIFGIVTVIKIVVGMVACFMRKAKKAETTAYALTIIGLFIAVFSVCQMLYIRTIGLNTCYRQNFNLGSEAEDEYIEFNSKFWLVLISGGIYIVMAIWFNVLYASNTRMGYLFTTVVKEKREDDDEFGLRRMDKLIDYDQLGKGKKILYKF